MGREVKRVALDFKWPQNKAWKGFLNPHYGDCHSCEACDGYGLSGWAKEFEDQWWGRVPFRPESIGLGSLDPSHPEIMRFARRQTERSPGFYGTGDAAVHREAVRMAAHYNSYRKNFLTQAEIDLVLADDGFSASFFKVLNDDGSIIDRTGPLDPEFVTSTCISGPGIDVNYSPILAGMEKEKGSSYNCSKCDGEGSLWTSEEAKQIAENWEPTEPPEGEGWQLWETVSEGSPVSPVFATAEELASWLAGPESSEADSVNRGTSREQWLKFLKGPGWAPSMIAVGGNLMGGVQGVVEA
jgi:hypothetical protein